MKYLKFILQLLVACFISYGAGLYTNLEVFHEGRFEDFNFNSFDYVAMIPGIFVVWCFAALIPVLIVGLVIQFLSWLFGSK